MDSLSEGEPWFDYKPDDYFTSQFYANTTHVFENYCAVLYGADEMNETINDDVEPWGRSRIHLIARIENIGMPQV